MGGVRSVNAQAAATPATSPVTAATTAATASSAVHFPLPSRSPEPIYGVVAMDGDVSVRSAVLFAVEFFLIIRGALYVTHSIEIMLNYSLSP